MKTNSLWVALFLAAAICGRADSPKVVDATAPSSPALTPVSPDSPVAMTPHAVQATVSVKWNESSLNVTVNYHNEGKTPLRIDGIKTTGGLFIVDYPRTVAPG